MCFFLRALEILLCQFEFQIFHLFFVGILKKIVLEIRSKYKFVSGSKKSIIESLLLPYNTNGYETIFRKKFSFSTQNNFFSNKKIQHRISEKEISKIEPRYSNIIFTNKYSNIFNIARAYQKNNFFFTVHFNKIFITYNHHNFYFKIHTNIINLSTRSSDSIGNVYGYKFLKKKFYTISSIKKEHNKYVFMKQNYTHYHLLKMMLCTFKKKINF